MNCAGWATWKTSHHESRADRGPNVGKLIPRLVMPEKGELGLSVRSPPERVLFRRLAEEMDQLEADGRSLGSVGGKRQEQQGATRTMRVVLRVMAGAFMEVHRILTTAFAVKC